MFSLLDCSRCLGQMILPCVLGMSIPSHLFRLFSLLDGRCSAMCRSCLGSYVFNAKFLHITFTWSAWLDQLPS